MQALHLPENVRAPGTAFATMCASLKTVSLPGVTVLPKDAFAYCTELETVSFGECLASIGKYAFLDCAALRSIQIPSGTQEIRVGAYAFCDCKALEEIVLPDTVSLSSSVFRGCEGLKQAVLPGGIQTVPAHLFDACSSLESIVLPESVSAIGKYAFRDAAR